MACIFGDIMKIDTTGESEMTAKQDDLTIKGVEASQKLAENDLARMEKYKSLIIKVGKAKKMEPAVIAAIISRESKAGAVLKDGCGDHGNGFGLMQVGIRNRLTNATTLQSVHGTMTSISRKQPAILIDNCQAVKAKFPQWSPERQFRGGISAYNAGVKNVRSYEYMDLGTTGDDYGNDVVARAQWFKSNGYCL